MTKPFIGHLSSELEGLKQSGLYKTERVITSKQAGQIIVNSGAVRHDRSGANSGS